MVEEIPSKKEITLLLHTAKQEETISLLEARVKVLEELMEEKAQERAVLMASSKNMRMMDAFVRVISRLGQMEGDIKYRRDDPRRWDVIEQAIGDIERMIMPYSERGGNHFEWKIAKENPMQVFRRLMEFV